MESMNNGTINDAARVKDIEQRRNAQRRERLAGNILCALLAKYVLNEPGDQDTLIELSVQLADGLIRECKTP